MLNLKASDYEIEIEDDRLPLALDRRTVDVDGRLHVPDCNISKANVCAYIGAEIPGYATLGLVPTAVYMLYRDCTALAAAASTFANVPLMMTHVAVSADDPQKMLTVGTVSNVRWKAPYLVADLAVWDAVAIAAINSNEQRELSCGYRYVPIMKPGEIDGERFDGRMTQIVGNHVALVETGRAGPDVVVRDSALWLPMHKAIPHYGRLR